MKWKNRIKRFADIDPKEVKPNPQNMRIHPVHQQQAVRDLLADYGWLSQIIINERTGNLIDGHLRVEQAIEQEQPTVPVVYVDISEAEELEVLAFFDQITAMALGDVDVVEELLGKVKVQSEPLIALLDRMKDMHGLGEIPGYEQPQNLDRFKDPDAYMTIGTVQFKVDKETFLRWRESLYQTVGFDSNDIVDELRRRLDI